MTEILIDYDPAEDLYTPEAISIFVNEALKTDDAAHIALALGVVARAKGMAGIAREAGLSGSIYAGHCQARAIRLSRPRLR